MKSLGIVRKIDELGRVVIPKSMRDINGWVSGTSMEMFSDGNKLVLAQYKTDETKEQTINDLEKAAFHTQDKSAKEALEQAVAYIKQQ